MLLCTMGAAIKDAIRLHAVPDHPDTAMGTGGRQRMDRAFEAIEDVRLTLHPYLKALVVYVAAYFASHPVIPLGSSFFGHSLPLSQLF
jgi:hypothetical protein